MSETDQQPEEKGLSAPFDDPYLSLMDDDRMAAGRYTLKTENISDRAIGSGIYILVTLGLYYFVFLTRERKMMWSNTVFDSKRLRFQGTAFGALFRFLFAVLCFAAVGGAMYQLWQNSLIDPLQKAAGFAAGAALVFALYQFFSFLRLRYLVGNTEWRDRPFSVKGWGIGYTVAACVWLVLSILTLGLLAPFMAAALRRMRIRSIGWNGINAQSGLSGVRLGIPYFLIWLSFFISVGFVMFRMAPELPSSDITDYVVFMPEPPFVLIMFLPVLEAFLVLREPLQILALVYAALAVVTLPYFYGRARRLTLSSISFGDARFQSRFSSRSVYSSMVITLVALGIAGGIAGGAAYAVYRFLPDFIADYSTLRIAQPTGYFVLTFVAFPILFWCYWVGLVNRMWAKSVRTLIVGPMGGLSSLRSDLQASLPAEEPEEPQDPEPASADDKTA